jgi:hypothetical protein
MELGKFIVGLFIMGTMSSPKPVETVTVWHKGKMMEVNVKSLQGHLNHGDFEDIGQDPDLPL